MRENRETPRENWDGIERGSEEEVERRVKCGTQKKKKSSSERSAE